MKGNTLSEASSRRGPSRRGRLGVLGSAELLAKARSKDFMVFNSAPPREPLSVHRTHLSVTLGKKEINLAALIIYSRLVNRAKSRQFPTALLKLG